MVAIRDPHNIAGQIGTSTTPRTGPEIRSDLKALGRRAGSRFIEGEEKLEQVTEEPRDKVPRAKAELQS